MIRKTIILLLLGFLAVNTYCSGGSGTDDNNGGGDTPGSPANGVFAKLIVGRMVYVANTDTIEALFSDTYDPCAASSDLDPTSISCNAYDLAWDSNLNLYIYQETPTSDFLIPGDTYTFNVTASSSVPDLTADIVFPATEPEITSPVNNGTESLSGFDIEWLDYEGSGNVQIILLNITTNDTISFETADDGSHTLTAADLSGLPAGMYYLRLEKYIEENINAAGYDSRSIIRSRNIFNLMLTLN